MAERIPPPPDADPIVLGFFLFAVGLILDEEDVQRLEWTFSYAQQLIPEENEESQGQLLALHEYLLNLRRTYIEYIASLTPDQREQLRRDSELWVQVFDVLDQTSSSPGAIE